MDREKGPTIYTIYFEKKAGSDEHGRATVSISRPGDNAGFDQDSLEKLAQEFVGLGWRISNVDTLQTITPVILNKWAPKPWATSYGIPSCVEKGELMQYLGLSGAQMVFFYKTYLSEVAKKAQK